MSLGRCVAAALFVFGVTAVSDQTVQETGFKDFDLDIWFGVVAPGACGADYAAFTRKQYDDYGRGIRDAKPN